MSINFDLNADNDFDSMKYTYGADDEKEWEDIVIKAKKEKENL